MVHDCQMSRSGGVNGIDSCQGGPLMYQGHLGIKCTR